VEGASDAPYKEVEKLFTIMSTMITICSVPNNTRKDMEICELLSRACEQNPRKHIVRAT
jgi:hypothetical protein